jgi:regulatory protein
MEHRITDLIPQKRNPQRINVYLDGEYAFSLAKIVAAWLKAGQTLSDEKIHQLQAQDAKEASFQLALKLLNYHPRTETELRQKLAEHNVEEDRIEETIERLKTSGLINDNLYAQTWVENRSAARPRSRRALSYELKHRGIDQEIIESALESVDDEAMAYQAGSKYARRLQDLERRIFHQKLVAYLMRKGFNYDISAHAASRIWDEMQAILSTQVKVHNADAEGSDDPQVMREAKLC